MLMQLVGMIFYLADMRQRSLKVLSQQIVVVREHGDKAPLPTGSSSTISSKDVHLKPLLSK